MSDIFREVDDALKQEKVAAFWSKYGNIVIGGVLLIIVGTGLYSGYRSWKHASDEKNTAIILDLYKNPTDFENKDLSQLNASQKSMADLFIARQHLSKKEYDKAFTIFEKVKNDSAIEANTRGLAAYYARNMALNNHVDRKLEDITFSTPSIWDGHLKLQDALSLGSEEKKYADAIALLDQIITNADKNQTLLEQAQQLKYVYTYDLEKMEKGK